MPSSKDSDSTRRRRAIGHSYEKLAATYFTDNGFEILDRNWQAGHKEIDLIVSKENLLVFVEVKSASTTKFGHPASRVDQKKINNLTLAAQQYLIEHEIQGRDLRFDLVTFLDGWLEHFPNAFEASQ